MPTSNFVSLNELLQRQLDAADLLIRTLDSQVQESTGLLITLEADKAEMGKVSFLADLNLRYNAKFDRLRSDVVGDIAPSAGVLVSDLMSAGIALAKGTEKVLELVSVIAFPLALVFLIIGGVLGVRSAKKRKESADLKEVPNEELFLLFTIAQNFTNLRIKNEKLTAADKKLLLDVFDPRLRKLMLDEADKKKYSEIEKWNQFFRGLAYGWSPIAMGSSGLLFLTSVAIANHLSTVELALGVMDAIFYFTPVISFVAAASFLYTAGMFWYKYAEACRRLEKVKQEEQPKINEINQRINDLKSQLNTLENLTVKTEHQNTRIQQLNFIINELALQRTIRQAKIDCLQRHPDLRLTKGIAFTAAGTLMLAAAIVSLVFALNPAGLGVLAGVATILVISGVAVLSAYAIHNYIRERSLNNAQKKLKTMDLIPIGNNKDESGKRFEDTIAPLPTQTSSPAASTLRPQ